MTTPGPRPLTRAQQLENAAFLRALRRTGNVRAAARAVGAHRAKFTKRRARHSAFAAAWDAALAVAHAALKDPPRSRGGGSRTAADGGGGRQDNPRIHRTKSGRLQLRRAQPGRLDRDAEQRFLAALSATANVRLSARAAGFTHAAFYARKRTDSGFAREWRLALAAGYDTLELALLEGWSIEGHQQDAWRHNDPPAIPPMSANQALQLMYQHQKEARLWETPVPDRLRPGETREARSIMLGMIYEAKQQQDREAFRIAEALRRDRGEPTHVDWEAEGNPLPDLSQVKGWSKADPAKSAADPTRALFGGWRLGDVKNRRTK